MWRSIGVGSALALLVVRGAVAAPASPALAAPEPPSAPSRSQAPSLEVPIGIAQVTLGSLGTLVGTGLALAFLGSHVGDQLFAPALVMPALDGLLVCGIGRWSRQYTGGCGAAILGAYAGSLISVPLGYAFCKARMNDGEFGCLGGMILGYVIGETVGGTIGATIGWHVAKKPRAGDERLVVPPAPGEARADDWPELRARPSLSTPTPPGTTVSVPLLALAF